MIDLIVFSKNRAAQLDLLLRSISRFYPDLFHIIVVYKADEDYIKSYDILTQEYAGKVWFHQEDSSPLYTNANTAYVKSHMLMPYNRWVMFSTDDQVFFRRESLNPDNLPQHQDQVFSFRLGFNTIEQDIHKGTKQPPLNNYVRNQNILKWSPSCYFGYDNYGYPLAVDNHVFTVGFFRDLISKIPYKSTNQLETDLQKFRWMITEMSSFTHSVSVNIPANNLSGCTIAGQTHGYSPELLNTEFLAGKRINLDKIVNTPIIGCHQEIPLELV